MRRVRADAEVTRHRLARAEAPTGMHAGAGTRLARPSVAEALGVCCWRRLRIMRN